MKKNAMYLLGAVLALLLLTTGCGQTAAEPPKDGLPQPEFPLEEVAVLAAAEDLGMTWEVDEEETLGDGETRASYLLRDPETGVNTAAVSSSMAEGKRFLQVIFWTPDLESAPAFAWEDWKTQLTLTARLFGGFAGEEALYQALTEQTIPDGKTAPEFEAEYLVAEEMKWDAVLPGGYAQVRYQVRDTRVEKVFPEMRVLEQKSQMTLLVYESEEQYQEMREAAQAQKEALAQARKDAQA